MLSFYLDPPSPLPAASIERLHSLCYSKTKRTKKEVRMVLGGGGGGTAKKTTVKKVESLPFSLYRFSHITVSVPEFIYPVFAKTSPKRSFSVVKTGYLNSGTGLLI